MVLFADMAVGKDRNKANVNLGIFGKPRKILLVSSEKPVILA